MAMLLGINAPGLILGQSKLAASLRTSRGVGQPSSSTLTSQTLKTGALKSGLQVAGQLAKWGAYAYFGVEALKYGMQQLRPEMVETSAQSSGAWYGPEGMGGAYARGVDMYAQQNAMVMQDAQAQAYQEYSPVYQQASVNKIWAEQQARYEANLQYPTFPVQTDKTTELKMPYTPKIL